jgi:hypothetical protein
MAPRPRSAIVNWWRCSLTTNATRAAWAEDALATFTHHAFSHQTPEQLHPDDLRAAIADLLADLGHYVDRRFRKRVPFPDLVAHGVGMWSAERKCRDGEPGINDTVTVTINE